MRDNTTLFGINSYKKLLETHETLLEIIQDNTGAVALKYFTFKKHGNVNIFTINDTKHEIVYTINGISDCLIINDILGNVVYQQSNMYYRDTANRRTEYNIVQGTSLISFWDILNRISLFSYTAYKSFNLNIQKLLCPNYTPEYAIDLCALIEIQYYPCINNIPPYIKYIRRDDFALLGITKPFIEIKLNTNEVTHVDFENNIRTCKRSIIKNNVKPDYVEYIGDGSSPTHSRVSNTTIDTIICNPSEKLVESYKNIYAKQIISDDTYLDKDNIMSYRFEEDTITSKSSLES